jgi:hypothetical protein
MKVDKPEYMGTRDKGQEARIGSPKYGVPRNRSSYEEDSLCSEIMKHKKSPKNNVTLISSVG